MDGLTFKEAVLLFEDEMLYSYPNFGFQIKVNITKSGVDRTFRSTDFSDLEESLDVVKKVA